MRIDELAVYTDPVLPARYPNGPYGRVRRFVTLPMLTVGEDAVVMTWSTESGHRGGMWTSLPARWRVHRSSFTGRWIAERVDRSAGYSFPPGCHEQAFVTAARAAQDEEIDYELRRAEQQESARKRARALGLLWVMLIVTVLAACVAGIVTLLGL